MQIAARHGNDSFAIPLSRLSDIETKGVVPSIYRLYSLTAIYRRDLPELLSWYGVEFGDLAADMPAVEVPRSHPIQAFDPGLTAEIPVQLSAEFDLSRTAHLGQMIEQWGVVPLPFLSQLAKSGHTYAYVGTEDFTMYPILLPGSFVQIDETRNKVTEERWRSEYERPIYFVETRDGYTCCWCSVSNGVITLQPHPLSPVPVRVLRHPREAEVIGQVIGIAMRLDSRKGSSADASLTDRVSSSIEPD
jgi:hypothetical protein